jgi:hypothetical protein
MSSRPLSIEGLLVATGFFRVVGPSVAPARYTVVYLFQSLDRTNALSRRQPIATASPGA